MRRSYGRLVLVLLPVICVMVVVALYNTRIVQRKPSAISKEQPSQKVLSLSQYLTAFSGGLRIDLAEPQVQACLASLRSNATLEQRLSECPTLTSLMIWERGDGARFAYSDWEVWQKNRIEQIFQMLLRREPNLNLQCPDPAAALGADNKTFYYTNDQAFDVFAAHVAHILYLEATSAVPWTILRRPNREIAELLSSFNYFSRILHPPIRSFTLPVQIQENRDFSTRYRTESQFAEIECDPRVAYNFVRGLTSTVPRDLVGADELETLVNLNYWFYNNVGHGNQNGVSADEKIRLSSLVQRLTVSSFGNDLYAQNFLHQTIARNGVESRWGCHTAANLLYSLARSVNIPLLIVRSFDFTTGENGALVTYNSGHSGLAYGFGSSSPLVLPHTDNIYAMLWRPTFLASGNVARKFFDETWQTPSVLRSWGFNLIEGLPLITPESPYSGYAQSKIFHDYNDRLEFGNIAGYWPNGFTDSAGFAHYPYERYFSEKNYQLCGFELLMSYCTQLSSFETVFANYFTPETRTPVAVNRTVHDFSLRAQSCLVAIGGCDQMWSRYQNFIEGWGADHYTTGPVVSTFLKRARH